MHSTRVPFGWTVTEISLLGGENLTALDSRLSSTWRNALRSASTVVVSSGKTVRRVRALRAAASRYSRTVCETASERFITSGLGRSEEHTSELQSRFGISYAVF